MSARELQERIQRLLEDTGAGEVTTLRMALEEIVDWLVEKEPSE